MKRFLVLTVCMVAVISLALVGLFNSSLLFNKPLTEHDRLMQSPAYRLTRQYNKEEQEEKGAEVAVKYLTQLRANQITGRVDFADVYNAQQQANQRRSQANKTGIPLGLQWEDLGPDNVGGRTRGLMIDNNNPEHMLAGSVAGGLFVSQNGGLSWAVHPSTDSLGHAGIATIRQASNGDMYIGTGESFAVALNGVPQSNGAPGFIGDGIYKSTDGGQTFSHLPSTTPVPNSNTDGWAYVNEIAIDPNNSQKVYAATEGGLKISSNGGLTWEDPSNITNNRFALEVAVGGNGVVHACINFKYYRSADGTSFDNLTGIGGFPPNNIGRIEFAVSPQDPNYVYSVISKSGFSGALNSVQRSTDTGLTWTPLIPSSSETFNVLGNQGTWNIALGVDPQNKDRIFVGGQTELWLYANAGWNQVATWFPDSPTNPYYVHADMHGIRFHPTNSNIMFVINDGGVYKSYNATQQFPTFTMRNKGYNVTQFYGMCASDYGYVIGGSQDNGTQLVDRKGNTKLSADEVSGGDGGDCEFSSLNPQVIFASSYGGRFVRSSNLGNSFGSFLDNNIDRNNDRAVDNPSLFVGTSFLWEIDESYKLHSDPDTFVENKKSVYFIAAVNQLWFTTEALNLSTQPYFYDVRVTGEVSEIEVSPDGTIFCGTTLGYVYRIDGLKNKYIPKDTIVNSDGVVEIKYGPDFPMPSKPATNYPGWAWPASGGTSVTYQGLTRITLGTFGNSRFVTGIAADPNNSSHVVVTLGNYGNQNYVYQSVSGEPFASIQNDLPRMPVYDAVIDYYNPNNIILGTELGIWTSTDQGLTWTEENRGLARTIVMKLIQRELHDSDCKVLYAGTHGRGMHRSTSITKNGCNLEPSGVPVGINDYVAPEFSGMQVYPSPVYNKAIVEFELQDINSPVKLMVIDLLGRSHKIEKLGGLQSGHNKLEVNFDDIAGGVYMIVLQTGNTSQSQRVVVAK